MARSWPQRLKLPTEIVAAHLRFAVDPRAGSRSTAAFDLEGFRNVLKLRADMLGTWGGTPPAPEKYLDFPYYQRALASL